MFEIENLQNVYDFLKMSYQNLKDKDKKEKGFIQSFLNPLINTKEIELLIKLELLSHIYSEEESFTEEYQRIIKNFIEKNKYDGILRIKYEILLVQPSDRAIVINKQIKPEYAVSFEDIIDTEVNEKYQLLIFILKNRSYFQKLEPTLYYKKIMDFFNDIKNISKLSYSEAIKIFKNKDKINYIIHIVPNENEQMLMAITFTSFDDQITKISKLLDELKEHKEFCMKFLKYSKNDEIMQIESMLEKFKDTKINEINECENEYKELIKK